VIVYLDTSAFVKLILQEEGAVDARSWFDEASPAVSSVITYPEACAALGRRARASGPESPQRRAWIAELEARWRRVVSVRVDSRPAGELALRHGLRGMDAVQLAAAVNARERLRRYAEDADLVFAAFDRQLLQAAEREGFATLGAQLE
jgi:predicted nucleic acid-binding protein